MPYVSQAQAGYFHTHKAELEKQGVNVNEWDQATKGKKLPKRAKKYDGDEVDIDPINARHGVAAKAAARLARIKAGKDIPDVSEVSDSKPVDKPSKKEDPKQVNPYGFKGIPKKYPDSITEEPTPTPTPQYDGEAEYDGGDQSGYSPFSNYGTNLGTGSNPWDQTWGQQGGQYTAPLDPTAAGAINNQADFVGSGMGLGQGNNFLNDTLQGKYLTEQTNPYLGKINSGMEGIKADQDEQQRRRIASAMSAGGNALSGARLEAEQRAETESNNNFNNTWGNILSKNYQNERGLQNNAASMLPTYANTQRQGNNDAIAAGMIPTNMAQSDIDRQRADWERQTNNMYRDYTQGNKTFNDLIHGGYSGSQQPNYGDSALSGILGALGLGGSGGLGDLLKQLLGGGKGGGSKSGGGSGGGSGNSGGTGATRNSDGSYTNRSGVPSDQNGNPLDQNGGVGQDQNGTEVYPDGNGGYVYQDGSQVDNATLWEMAGDGTFDPSGGEWQGPIDPNEFPENNYPQDPYGGEGYQDPSGGYGDPGGDYGYDNSDFGGDYSDGSEGW